LPGINEPDSKLQAIKGHRPAVVALEGVGYNHLELRVSEQTTDEKYKWPGLPVK
jgi:hypothetical protein